MKAYKLYLVNYSNPVIVYREGKESEETQIYRVRHTLASVLCHPNLKLVGLDFYRNAVLGDKIMNCTDDYITLSQEDFENLKKAFGQFQGFSRNDAELVKRVYEAEQVEVKTNGNSGTNNKS